MNIFDEAMEAYDRCISVLSIFTETYKKFCDDNEIEYDPEVTLSQFDLVLQYSMLQLALNDGYLDEGEIYFIRDITKHGDLCEYLDRRGIKGITWEGIYKSNELMVSKLLNKVGQEIYDMSSDFIHLFVANALVIPMDFFPFFQRDIYLIFLATCHADGDINNEGEDLDCLMFDILDQIKNSIDDE